MEEIGYYRLEHHGIETWKQIVRLHGNAACIIPVAEPARWEPRTLHYPFKSNFISRILFALFEELQISEELYT